MNDEFIRLLGPWLGGISALIASAMALVSWSYETFETKEISRERQTQIERRLERIENKIDSIRTRN
jgi:hypothetical protein